MFTTMAAVPGLQGLLADVRGDVVPAEPATPNPAMSSHCRGSAPPTAARSARGPAPANPTISRPSASAPPEKWGDARRMTTNALAHTITVTMIATRTRGGSVESRDGRPRETHRLTLATSPADAPAPSSRRLASRQASHLPPGQGRTHRTRDSHGRRCAPVRPARRPAAVARLRTSVDTSTLLRVGRPTSVLREDAQLRRRVSASLKLCQCGVLARQYARLLLAFRRRSGTGMLLVGAGSVSPSALPPPGPVGGEGVRRVPGVPKW